MQDGRSNVSRDLQWYVCRQIFVIRKIVLTLQSLAAMLPFQSSLWLYYGLNRHWLVSLTAAACTCKIC